jgi:uncharacterized membrane protein YfcA
MAPWLAHSALFAVGLVAGALNVVAGGGSFLTLPALIFLGLPASVANGTNRIGILTQNVGAVWGFDRYKVLRWRWATWTALPAAAGAVFGTWGALVIPDPAFKRVLAFLMVAISLWTLWDPVGRRGAASGGGPETAGDDGARAAEDSGAAPPAGARRWLLAAAFFAVGLYTGFVQAGVGFLILAATTLAGLDLVRGNALKVLVILVATPLSLAIFAGSGRVDWPLGLTLAAGNLLGGLLGVRLTVLKGHRWVKGVVTATVIVFALKLWFER